MIERGALIVGLALALGGCAEPESSQAELEAIQQQAAVLSGDLDRFTAGATDDDGVVVRLMFRDDVDLDLYVTDPLLETVYFARHETRTGGVIRHDVRCDSEGPRIEEIRFPTPWPGRYRVGVDFPHRCDGASTRAPAPYAVRVTVDGRHLETYGLVNREFFEVEVLTFEVDEPDQNSGDTGT